VYDTNHNLHVERSQSPDDARLQQYLAVSGTETQFDFSGCANNAHYTTRQLQRLELCSSSSSIQSHTALTLARHEPHSALCSYLVLPSYLLSPT